MSGEMDMPDQPNPAHDDEDEQHRLFREALERKKARHNEMHADGTSNRGVGEARNDKHARQFRRKSG